MEKVLRQQLVNLLTKQQAHMGFEEAVAAFPQEHINTHPTGVDYSFWHLLEHIRFAQWDILDYIRNPDYQSHPWPEGYWRNPDETTDKAGWNKTIQGFLDDRQALVDIVEDSNNDLTAPIPHAFSPEHSILREILVVADHNAYHIGELAILRQVMGLW